MAIFTEQQIVDILNGAPAVTPDIIFRQMGGVAHYGGDADLAYMDLQNMWYSY